eukprot:1145836-Pelagomonas_calceolata.AAC.15
MPVREGIVMRRHGHGSKGVHACRDLIWATGKPIEHAFQWPNLLGFSRVHHMGWDLARRKPCLARVPCRLGRT